MSKLIDMTGEKQGRLTVLEKGESNRHNQTRWWCQCECGNKVLVERASLIKGLTKSCGCLKKETLKKYNDAKTVNEIGHRYGKLLVLSQNFDKSMQQDNRAMWNCLCDCGKECVVSGKNLREGHVTSCGCRRQSKGEERIEKLLLENNFIYAMEYLVDVRKERIYQHHKARFDFAIFNEENKLQYFIEFDGEQHFEEQCHRKCGFATEEQYKKTHERDLLKNQWCKDNNIPLIRIPFFHLPDLCIEDLKLETSNFIVTN